MLAAADDSDDLLAVRNVLSRECGVETTREVCVCCGDGAGHGTGGWDVEIVCGVGVCRGC